MSTKTVSLKNQIGPTSELPEVFERAEDRERREYAQNGCDLAYFICLALRGRRRLDIQPKEIIATQVYQRSDEIERKALRLVCEVDHEVPASPDDEVKLKLRDQLLCDYADGKLLGRADAVAAIRAIPHKVKEREYFDQMAFPNTWPSPKLFGWLLDESKD